MKGSMADILFLMVVIGVIGIVIAVASLITTSLSGTDLMTSDYEYQVDSALQVIDANAAFLIIGIAMAIALMALTIKVHPIFIFPALIVIMVIIMVSPMISNSFMEVATSDGLVAESDKFENIVYQMAYMPYIIVVIAFIMLIALYAKPGGGR